MLAGGDLDHAGVIVDRAGGVERVQRGTDKLVQIGDARARRPIPQCQFASQGHTDGMRLRLGRFEMRSAPVDSGEVRGRNASREQGQALLDDVARLRPAQRWAGQLGRLAGDGWTSEQVQQFIDTWPTASAVTLVKLLHSANTLNHGADAIDVARLAAATHKRFEIDDHGRVRRRS